MPTIVINKLLLKKNYVSAKKLFPLSHLIFRSTKLYRGHTGFQSQNHHPLAAPWGRGRACPMAPSADLEAHSLAFFSLRKCESQAGAKTIVKKNDLKTLRGKHRKNTL